MDSGSGRSDPRPVTAKEEAVKRNTDCVYFLASPLTCKKGSECEYRHSEGARVNPRDCRYWLKGNCLNPKCLFRHPPLDGLVGNTGDTSVPLFTATQITPSMQLSVANSSALNPTRNTVPCYYFQMGGCLKGDKCSFVHGPQPAVNLAVQPAAKSSVPVGTQLEKPKETLGIKKCDGQQNFSTKESAKPINGSNKSAKGLKVLENPSTNFVHNSSLLPHSGGMGLSRSQATNVHMQADEHHQLGREDGEIFREPSRFHNTSFSGPVNHRIRSLDDSYRNGRGAEEALRESSPGFDVLVDDVVEDTEFFHDRDGFTTVSVHGERDLRTSSVSERISEKPISSERRSAGRLRSPDNNVMDVVDLRHQLLKQRRLNGFLPANTSDHHVEPCRRNEQNLRDRSNKLDLRKASETTLSSRLRGRITLPTPSSPEIPFDVEVNRDRIRQRSRLSPVRQSVTHARHGERSSRWREDDSAITRSLSKQLKARDVDDSLDFAGPKSLAELKGVKPSKAATLEESETISFEGPKPLSALLKRKREPGSENDGASAVSYGIKESGEREVISSTSSAGPIPEMLSVNAVEAGSNLEELKVGAVEEEEEEGLFPAEDEQITYEQQYTAEDQELDYADGRGKEGNYARYEDENYGTEDENPMDVDVEVDDDDADDFAKKIGLIFS
ncbi:Zinc finger CCCH domain-containing protein 19 [Apostasia shenzhenica]|uniref:Zinc finger CCCH domain-containing protein 19 n=1 Tax=Apostasia shenzhenica TaxID=1088818 RepID=A0A2H9ZYS6_9ASPA|nr:Zinc finger CCCH domain-containing protein 19 [Apostasia shenzhenica]